MAPYAAAQTQTADAAPPAAPEAQNQNGLEQVLVTARRKTENAEKVPTSITALGKDQLEERQIMTEADLQRSVPGLTIRESLSQNQLNYSIRGQSVDAYSSSSPGVLPYINDVQLSSVSANTLFDLDSVQVLKGPQGTLFGRNTTGGAVLYSTAKPTDDFSGGLTARFGDYNLHEFQGYLNVPIVADKLLVRVSGDIIRRDGYVKNLFDNSELGEDSSQSGRVSVMFKPIDKLENDTVFQYTEIGGTNIGGEIYSVNACGAPGLSSATACLYSPSFPGWPAFLAAHPGVFPGGLEAYTKLQQKNPYVVDFDGLNYFNSKNPYVTNTTTYQFDDDLLFKNIFGWNKSTSNQSTDVDGTPYPIYSYGPEHAQKGTDIGVNQWSDEAQIQGKLFNESLSYIVGAYYSHEENTFFIPETVFDLTAAAPPPATYTFNNEQNSDSEAAFIQTTYDLSQLTGLTGLSATTGFRYTWEQIRTSQLSQSLFFGAADLQKSFNDPSWTVGLEYQVDPDLLVYATQRGSWRSGGFNANKFPAEGLADVFGSEFLPETTEDVEIGAKFQGQVGGRPLRLNLAAYNQWIDDVQRVQYVLFDGGPTAVTVNVPSAEVTGFEGDVEFVPNDWLKVGGSLAFADARFTNGQVVLFGNATNFGPYADTPKWTGNVFVQVFFPVTEGWGDVSLRADMYGQSRFFYSNLNETVNPGSEISGYSTTNFRLDWTNIHDSRLSAALFMTNAFDKTYYTGGLALGSVLGVNTAIPGRPRMFGGELKYTF